ncbi:LOW QUALITY PROTEIN: hypothetical protein NC653_011828 [Populus alba x Populus x berolinensis]|uniref:Uncharacterized protein n=1 Tax=Populus alba x Populus x berolinensis TaxID=444605 RepID=A0AAD6W7F2_9ROSI|nr:LOW QUALITY PROTEIN: hypothetical protein NC653_011828 [Populus alba x Populus x berolinensis]
MSFANIISPLIFSPLTALFLSEDAPFHFPGFSILCIGFATMIAFFQSVLMRGPPPISSHKICSNSLPRPSSDRNDQFKVQGGSLSKPFIYHKGDLAIWRDHARKIRTAFNEIFSIICIIDTSIRLQAPARNLYATAFSYDGRLDSNEKDLLQSQRSAIVFNYL